MQASEAPDDLIVLIAMTRRRIKQTVSNRLVRFELGPQQFWVLLNLRKEEGLSLHELARRTWTDDPTACRMVGKLIERGLIRSEEDPADRRRFRLGLTAKGRKLATELESFALEIRTTVARGMSGDDRRQLCNLLRKVMVNTDALEEGQNGARKKAGKDEGKELSPKAAAKLMAKSAVKRRTKN
jgi:DNA-binding MarR family transcriptional regulator